MYMVKRWETVNCEGPESSEPQKLPLVGVFTWGFCVLRSRGSTIRGGGHTTISSPGRSPKQPLPGMRLHDPLHGRQACSKFIAFDLGVGLICLR